VECTLQIEVVVAFPAELDVLVCDDCGCTLQALAFSEAGEVVRSEPQHAPALTA
jgi:hypothetical protein